jgi:hypothetical protein
MLDHPEKTPRLLAALKAAAPFEVKLLPSLTDHLQAENVVNAGRTHQVVWDLSYAGDEGGITIDRKKPSMPSGARQGQILRQQGLVLIPRGLGGTRRSPAFRWLARGGSLSAM